MRDVSETPLSPAPSRLFLGEVAATVQEGKQMSRQLLASGAAFGVGTSYTAVIALIVCGVIAYIIRIARRLRSLAWTIALGLLLGGALGNLGDRLFRGPGPFRGQVVDWLNLPHFPWTFNLADASITCAAVMIAVLALRGVRIDGTSPAHAADRIGGNPLTPSVAPAPRDGTTRLVDSDDCAS